jgi:hypothetical protein
MAKPGAIPGTGSVCARQEKTPPILPFTVHKETDRRLRVGRRDAPRPRRALLPPNPNGRRRFRYAQAYLNRSSFGYQTATPRSPRSFHMRLACSECCSKSNHHFPSTGQLEYRGRPVLCEIKAKSASGMPLRLNASGASSPSEIRHFCSLISWNCAEKDGPSGLFSLKTSNFHTRPAQSLVSSSVKYQVVSCPSRVQTSFSKRSSRLACSLHGAVVHARGAQRGNALPAVAVRVHLVPLFGLKPDLASTFQFA